MASGERDLPTAPPENDTKRSEPVVIQEWRDYLQNHHPGVRPIVGTLKVLTDLYSPQLDNARDVLIHLPDSYGSGERRYPVIYMHDGQNLFDEFTSFAGAWRVDEALASLRDEGREVIAVGIPNTGARRCDEYSPFVDERRGGGRGDAYLRFIGETLKPLIDRDFHTLPDRARTGILGSSMGGLISLYAFFRYPEIFGFAGAMSPSLWFADRAIFPFIEAAAFVPGKLYLDAGTAEGPGGLRDVRDLRALLIRKGYRRAHDNKLYVEDEGAGHHEAAWGRRLREALRFLVPQADRVP